jgi:hypothetical protein
VVDPIDNLHAVFAMCSITNEVTHPNIIAQEGITQLEDLGLLKTDTNVSQMAKRMVTCTHVVEGRVLLRMVMIKWLRTLVWWARDQQKRGLALNAVNFDAVAMNQASEMKTLRSGEQAEKEQSILDLGKFDPDNFDLHEDAFFNLLA